MEPDRFKAAKCVSTADVARSLGIALTTPRMAVQKGNLRAIAAWGSYLVERARLEEYRACRALRRGGGRPKKGAAGTNGEGWQ